MPQSVHNRPLISQIKSRHNLILGFMLLKINFKPEHVNFCEFTLIQCSMLINAELLCIAHSDEKNFEINGNFI